MHRRNLLRRYLQNLVRHFFSHPSIGIDDPAAAERAAQLTVILAMEVFLAAVSLVLHVIFGEPESYLERLQLLVVFLVAGLITLKLARTKHYLKVSFCMIGGLLALMLFRINGKLMASQLNSLYLDMATLGCTAMLGTLVLPPWSALITALVAGGVLIVEMSLTAGRLSKDLWAGVLLYFSCALFTITGAYTREYFLKKMVQAKRVAEEQYRSRVRLQAELAQKEAEKQVVQKISEMKTRFVSQVSHEIRTPLHAILSFARFGVSKGTKVSAEKVTEYFSEIQASGQNLLQLLGDILDLSKIESGKMHYEFADADFKALCTRSVKEFRLAAQERNLTLDCPPVLPSVYLKIDDTRISQVLKNLISNALKYSQEGTMVSLRWAVQKTDWSKNPCLVFSILNKGTLPLNTQNSPAAELFSPFTQFGSDSHLNINLGTGLGLTICKEIIEAHAGRIWATASDDQKTVGFHFAIPQHT